jgi:hypothetical protein
LDALKNTFFDKKETIVMNYKRLTGLVLSLIFLFSGCQFGMVESVEIVADPTLEVALGTKSGVFSEFIDIDEELDSLTNEESDDYMEGVSRVSQDDGETITLNLTQDMIDISVDDFADENLDLNNINETIEEVTFTIPDIAVSENIALDFDTITLPDGVTLPSASLTGLPEFSSSQNLGTQTTTTLSSSGFDSLTFDSGTLTGAVAVSDGSTGLIVNITNASIIDDSTSEIITSDLDGIIADGSLIFDLEDVTLPSSFKITMDITVSGGTVSENFNLAIDFSISGEEISAATGITLDESVNSTITIPVNSSGFSSATVSEGSVDLDLTFASGWSGIDKTIDMILTQNGTTIGSIYDVAIGNDVEWDFTNDPLISSIGTDDLTLTYEVNIASTSANSASFSVSSTEEEITGTADASLDKFSEIILIADDMDFENSFTNDIDSDVTTLVDIITFSSDAGISVSLVNDLPTGSDITITLDVPELGIISSSKIFPANTTAGESLTQTWDVSLTDNELDLLSDLDDSDSNGLDDIDFDLSISMSNYDDTTKQLTLNSILAGESYSLSGSVDANLEIESIHITGGEIADQYPEDTSEALDFSSINDFLPDTIEFDQIEAEMELEFGGSSTGISFDALIYAEYNLSSDTSDTPTTYYMTLIGTAEDTDGIPQTAVSYSEGDSNPDLSALGDLINLRATNVVLHYSVTITSATISVSGTDEQNIKASIVADIPFEVTATADTSLEDEDGASLIPAAEEDLFGRDGSSGDDDINEYLDMLSSATLTITFSCEDYLASNTDGDLLGIGFSMTETTTGLTDFEITETFTLQAGESEVLEINLDADDIARMIDDDSFEPIYDAYLMGPTDLDGDGTDDFSGVHRLVEGFDMDVTVTMIIESDVDYTIDL